MKSRTTRGWLPILAFASILSLVAAACDNGSESTSSGAAGKGRSDREVVADAEARLARWYEGTYGSLPDGAPAPASGKNVWVISCGQLAEGCQVPADAAVEAGAAVGWDMTLFDGKLDPSEYGTGIRQAVAASADAIVLVGVDCFLARQPIEEAKDAGALVFGTISLDCDDPEVGGKALFDGELSFGEAPDYASFAEAVGAAKADWLIAQTDGAASTITFRQDELLAAKHITDGFEKQLEGCGGCEIITVDFTLADFGPGLQQKVEQALLENPDANAVMVPYDAALTLGIDAGIRNSGRGEELLVIGGEGFQANFESVRQGGGQDAGTGYGFEWTGYAAVDGLIRLFAGEEVVDTGNGFMVWDLEHNMGDGARYEPPVDFESRFLENWGVD